MRCVSRHPDYRVKTVHTIGMSYNTKEFKHLPGGMINELVRHVPASLTVFLGKETTE